MGVADTRQSSFVELVRGGPMIVERYGGWSHGRPGTGFGGKRPAAVPWQLCRTFAAGMGKLDAEPRRTGVPAEADNAGQRRLVCIGIEAETAVTDAAHRLRRRFLAVNTP